MAAPQVTSGSFSRRFAGGVFHWFARPGRLAFIVALAAVASGIATYLALTNRGPFEEADPDAILALLLLDLVLGLCFAALIAWQIVRIIAARRTRSAGARLHSQLVVLFSLVAVAPTVVVAIFSAVTLNLGIESWFGDKVQTAVRSSVRVADAYVRAHKQSIVSDIANLSQILGATETEVASDRSRFVELVRVQGQILGLHTIHILQTDGRPYLRVNIRQDVVMTDPDPAELRTLKPGEITVFTDEETDQVRAIMRVPWLADGVLYIGRKVNPEVLDYQRETREAITSYERLESNRFSLQITFVLIYFVVSVLVLLAAVWLGLNFANRMVQPIGRLIGAAERVSNGDLSARVDVSRSGDEIEGLSRAFNRMTGQLQSQRNELIETNRQLDDRRRFTEAVLSGVSAGVLGLDPNGTVTAANRSALRLLGREQSAVIGQSIGKLIPAAGELIHAARTNGRARKQVDFVREDGEKRFDVQISLERSERGEAGLVVTFDDITQLVAAQRTAVWADVARRIAHEIKNPLTPIQLSAERLRRKYKKEIATEPEVFDQCTDTIIRHVNDIGRMVDEFSSFARMPEPVFQSNNLSDLIKQAVFLHKVAFPDIHFAVDLPEAPITASTDGRLLAQVLTNAIKNAGEAIQARLQQEGEGAAEGRIGIRLNRDGAFAVIDVIDNGLGWPRAMKARLTEPYVTTRKKGTGLGLAIVQKVIEDHGGRLILAEFLKDGRILEDESAPEADVAGAVLRMKLPLDRAGGFALGGMAASETTTQKRLGA